MQYIKHYYVNDVTSEYMTTTNDAPAKRHPVKEIPGLGVKFWSHDPDGIDVCISEIESDAITITDQEINGKFAVKVIAETQYNSLITLQKEIDTITTELYPDRYTGGGAVEEETLDAALVTDLKNKQQELKDLINSF
jgi:hypothetical protein